jgi:peptide chain release factor 1
LVPNSQMRSSVIRRTLEALHAEAQSLQGTAPSASVIKRIPLIKQGAHLFKQLEAAESSLSECQSLLSDPDPQLRALAGQEKDDLASLIHSLEKEAMAVVVPQRETDSRNCVLEVRGGVGGKEASLFAANLFAMYSGVSRGKGLKMEVIDQAETEIGGFREATALISGPNAFGFFKWEQGDDRLMYFIKKNCTNGFNSMIGVHRVQRVPDTEKSGRVHTSTALVAVLPEAEEIDVVINKSDLRIDTYRSQGAGGQHVNTTDSAVRITHLPTGIVVQCQDERSQQKNRDKAMKVLRSRILAELTEKSENERKLERSAQLGTGGRAERIRTYNYLQDRVTDHRMEGVTVKNIEGVLEGRGLLEIIDKLEEMDRQLRLKELGDRGGA